MVPSNNQSRPHVEGRSAGALDPQAAALACYSANNSEGSDDSEAG